MLYTVIPLGMIFPDGDYPSDEGVTEADETAKCESAPISTDLNDHKPKRAQ